MKVVFIGINANNAICNDNFFDRTISFYPTFEKENIYFTDKHLEKTTRILNNEYKNFVIDKIKELKEEYNNDVCFMIINKNVLEMLDGVDAEIITNLNNPIVSLLNDKKYTRELFIEKIPMLDYKWYKGNFEIKQKLCSENDKKIVLQKDSGSGGESTFLVDKYFFEEKMKLDNNSYYCLSNYVKNVPLNITLIIGQDETIFLPISAQLIKIENNMFKYIGGDFAYANNLEDNVKKQIYTYSQMIVEILKKQNYLGILGIDYILLENGLVKFMEINPRFQSSSFLLSKELEKKDNTNIAKLHYESLINKKIDKISISSIEKSFVNCSKNRNFKLIKNESETIYNGYYYENETAIYRRVFDRSIIDEDTFEKVKLR